MNPRTFGTKPNGSEELVAEMGASFLAKVLKLISILLLRTVPPTLQVGTDIKGRQ